MRYHNKTLQPVNVQISERSGSLSANHFLNLISRLGLIYNRLYELSQLSVNWDGYEAEPPAQEIIDIAFSFFENLHPKFIELLDVDSIYPNPSGTLTIDWENGSNIISLEIGQQTANYFVDIDGVYQKEENISDLRQAIPDRLNGALNKLFA